MKKIITIIIISLLVVCFTISTSAASLSVIAPALKIMDGTGSLSGLMTDFTVYNPLAKGQFYGNDIIFDNSTQYDNYLIPLYLPAFHSISQVASITGTFDGGRTYLDVDSDLPYYNGVSASESVIDEAIDLDAFALVFTSPKLGRNSIYNNGVVKYQSGIWFDGQLYEDFSSFTGMGLSSLMLQGTGTHYIHIDGTLSFYNSNEVVASYDIYEDVTAPGSFTFSSFVYQIYNPTPAPYVRFSGIISIIIEYDTATASGLYDYPVSIGTILEKQAADIDAGALNKNEAYSLEHIYESVAHSGSGSSAPSGTITVNSAGVHDVSGYQYVDIQIPPIDIYYSGDIENGTYEQSFYQNGVSGSIIMDVGNTYNKNSTLTIDENGSYNVGSYNFVTVDASDVIIDSPNMFQWLADAAESFLTFQIAPDFSIGGILLFVLGFALLVWMLKIFLGG